VASGVLSIYAAWFLVQRRLPRNPSDATPKGSICDMKLIPRHLVLLAFSTFAMGTEAFVYTGHLTALSRDLSVPVAQTGALAASFSATLALSGPIR